MYKLLILDDEPLVRRGIRTLVDFERLQITEIFEASNGEEGLALFKTHLPHLVLVDINMPKMNGLEFTAKAKEINGNAHIAIITGYNYFDYAVTALKAGVDDYILKPVSKNDVTTVLIKMIDKLNQESQRRAIESTLGTLKVEDAEDDSLREVVSQTIRQQLANPELSLTWLADELGFSSSYLSGLFKKTFGVPFQEYVLSERLEKAKLLLLSTDMKNYEISERVGFEDVNYFGTRFKTKYGMSPKQYKEQIKGGG